MIKKKAYFFAEPIEYTIDYQGRYNIPAVHRKTLKIIDASYTKHGFYISASDNNFVRAFPQSYREREIERHLDMPSENKDRLASVESHWMVEEVDAGDVIHSEYFETPEITSYAEFYNIALPYYFSCIHKTL